MFHLEPWHPELVSVKYKITTTGSNDIRRLTSVDEKSIGFLIGWHVGSMWAGPGAAQVSLNKQKLTSLLLCWWVTAA